jgi:hypothetical protein
MCRGPDGEPAMLQQQGVGPPMDRTETSCLTHRCACKAALGILRIRAACGVIATRGASEDEGRGVGRLQKQYHSSVS